MLTSEEIHRIISGSLKKLIQETFPQLNNTSIATPVQVFDQYKVQKYWFIPFLLKSKVRGSAIFDVHGKLVSHGVLSPNVQDESKWINKEFFEKVPEKLLAEVINFYKDYEMVTHFFSFDQTPQKWGWLICLNGSKEKRSVSVFIGPENWYEQRIKNGFEG